MKRVCFVAFDLSVIGGVEQVTASLANSLQEKYEVFVYSINLNHDDKKYFLHSNIHFANYLRGESRLRYMIQKTFFPFIRFIKENKIDVVLMMENYAALIVSWTRFFTRAKYVYCDHGALMNQWHRKDIVLIKFWDSLVAHKVVTLTRRTRDDFIRRFHIRKKKIQFIYNWIEPAVLEERQPYQPQSRKILSVGRFGAEKGYDMLVKVAAKSLPGNQDWSWDIYGEGETFNQIKKKIHDLGLKDQVHLKGGVKNVYQLFSEYAIIVLPSYREGLPLVLLEAKGSGIPMISFDIITGPREIINNNRDGYLIPPYDINKMADKLQELMNDETLRKGMSEATREGLEKFEKGSILKKWELLIDEL